MPSVPAVVECRRLGERVGKSCSKNTFHCRGRVLLRHYAEQFLGLSREQYDVRSCYGGPAVTGEVVLHTDNLYVMLFRDGPRGVRVLYRRCLGRKDFTGGQNRYTTPMLLADLTRDRVDALQR